LVDIVVANQYLHLGHHLSVASSSGMSGLYTHEGWTCPPRRSATMAEPEEGT
jgi:hypothetical protein